MKILILGVSGKIGNPLYQALSAQHEVIGTYCQHQPSNVPQQHLIRYHVENLNMAQTLVNNIKPDIIISALEGDFQSQREAHQIFANYIQKNGQKLIFLSSHKVFDAKPNKAYNEEDIPHAASPYGIFKFECERILENIIDKEKLLILRLPFIYSKEKANTLKADILSDNHAIYSNVKISMNTVDNIVKAVHYCIDKNTYGTLHLTSRDTIGYDECVKKLCNIGDAANDTLLTRETYCHALGCFESSLILLDNEEKYTIALESGSRKLPDTFYPTCLDMINTLI